MTYALTVKHGDELDEPDYAALGVMRRTLLGLLGHGVITELNTYSGPDETVWSYQEGNEDGGEVMLGLLDTLNAIAPKYWKIATAN